MQIETIKIKVAPTAGNEEGIVSINASDFDPEKHERYELDRAAAAKTEKTETDSERKKRGKKEETERQRVAAANTEK